MEHSINATDYRHLYKLIRRRNVTGKVLFTDGRERILLVKSPHKRYWSLPGGICELGETPSQGALREVKEEIGIDARIERLLVGNYSSHADVHGIAFYFYGGTVPADTALVLQEEEVSEYGFFTEEEGKAVFREPEVLAAIFAAYRDGVPRYLEDAAPLAHS